MNPISIRLSEALDARINAAASATGLSRNDIIKLSIDAGLKWMERNHYDTTRPLSDESQKELLTDIIAQLNALLHTASDRIIRLQQDAAAATAPNRASLALAAEDPVPYRTDKSRPPQPAS